MGNIIITLKLNINHNGYLVFIFLIKKTVQEKCALSRKCGSVSIELSPDELWNKEQQERKECHKQPKTKQRWKKTKGEG